MANYITEVDIEVSLNEAGHAIVEQAKIVLFDSETLKAKAAALKNKSRHLHITTCAPAPLWKLTAELSASFPDIKITSGMNDEDEIVTMLLSEKAEIAIVRKIIESEATAHYSLAFLKKNERTLRDVIDWAVKSARTW